MRTRKNQNLVNIKETRQERKGKGKGKGKGKETTKTIKTTKQEQKQNKNHILTNLFQAGGVQYPNCRTKLFRFALFVEFSVFCCVMLCFVVLRVDMLRFVVLL